MDETDYRAQFYEGEIEAKTLLDAIDTLRAELDQAQSVCAQAYQVVGCLLDDTGQFDTEHGEKILDNLSQHRLVHDDVLPWISAKTRR